MEKPKRPKRDLNTIAASIVRQATGQEPKRKPPRSREQVEPQDATDNVSEREPE
ncbi:MAG TPA: hypothetical protein VEX86_01420 [Longimicrobium sp.]|nr:hypothetical protein [Longimicrobium sp.]